MREKKNKNELGEAPRFAQPAKDPRDDVREVMKFYHLAKRFPSAVLEEASRCGQYLDEPGERLDLRKRFVFTCDPQSARDYDDAISLWKDRLGRRVLGVHIADVSHFVRPDTALDREAFKRSTSVYLADCVVPMLPEALSNGLCSLSPDEDKLAFSVFLTFNRSGEVVKRSFAKSIIRSRARFSYEQVMAVINGGKSSALKIPGAKSALKTILEVDKLARQLRAARFAKGALDLDIPEVEVLLDDSGLMSGIVSRDYDESHQMIEECMVAANEAVATELKANGIAILSRFHDKPDEEKIQLLREELRSLGVQAGNLAHPKVFAQFLQTVKSHPLYSTIAVMVLRSMKRAVYDSSETGHWGLAKNYYAHFTSPIRRYPDLVLHRPLSAYLVDKKSARIPPRTLAKYAEHTTEMEEVATEAERSILEIKKYRILSDEIDARLNIVYDAVIVKCTPYGCFVEIPSLAVTGRVHVSKLSRKFVRYNEYDHSLSAPGGGSWHIGDRLRVVAVRVDFEERRIDFVPVAG